MNRRQTTDGERAAESAPEGAAWARPSSGERLAIWLFVGCAIVFGGVVEMRSALLKSRMTDLDVYLRAAWAVRTGRDPYAITDDHGWHYHYPPLFAIVMIPLADPPPGQSRARMMPYQLAVAVWYVANLLLLAFAVNYLAGALERATAGRGGIPPPGGRSWWSLRLLPVLICIAPIGVALGRGQADLLLLALLCAMIGAILAGRSLAAGWSLAGAICLKLLPLYLLVYPLWRRDWRLLASCALGLTLGLVLIPAAFFGPKKALGYAQEWNRVLIQPALLGGADRSRAAELLDINATDSQSFVALIHRWRNLGETIRVPRGSRSRPLEPWATPAHWTISLLLTAAALLAAGRRRSGSPINEELFLSGLVIIMVLASPASHLHYYTLTVPLAMGLVMAGRNGAVYPRRKWRWLFAAFMVATALPLLPGLEALRDLGLASLGALALWCAGTTLVWRGVQAGSRL